MFDGIRYLNCLSNKQDGKHFRPIKTHRGDIVNIYFASNHLGVVAMYLSKYEMSKQDWPGVWWSRLTLSKTHHLLRAYTDVSGIPPKAPALGLTCSGFQDS